MYRKTQSTHPNRHSRRGLLAAAVASSAAVGLAAVPAGASASPILIGTDNDVGNAETVIHGVVGRNNAVLRIYNEIDGFALSVSGRSRGVFAGAESGVGLQATGIPAVRAIPDAAHGGKVLAIEAVGRLSFSSAALVKVAAGEKSARFTGFVLPRGALVLATVQEQRAGFAAASRVNDETIEVTLDRAAGARGTRVAVFVIEPPGLKFPRGQ